MAQLKGGTTIAGYTAWHYGNLRIQSNGADVTHLTPVDFTQDVTATNISLSGTLNVTGQASFGNRLAVGVTYPSAGLINGSLATRPAAIAMGDSDTGIAQNGDGVLELFANNTAVVTFASNSLATFASTMVNFTGGVRAFAGLGVGNNVTPTGTFSNGTAIAVGDNDTGIRSGGDGILEFWANGTLQTTINSTSANFAGTLQEQGSRVWTSNTLPLSDLIRRNVLSNAEGYVHIHRNNTSPVFYANQLGSGDIARFFKGTGSTVTSGSAQVTIANNADVTTTGAFIEGTQRLDEKYILASTKDAANGVAALDANRKILAEYLPDIAVNDVFPVASQAEMLALTAQRGDMAIRTDLNTTYVLSTDDPSVLANWLAIETPTDGVQTVNGYTQSTITLDYGDFAGDENIVLSNDVQLAAKESGGTVRSMVRMSAGNVAHFGNWSTPSYLNSSVVPKWSSSANTFDLIHAGGGQTIDGTLDLTGNITAPNLAIANWNTAFGWGDHSQEGYLTSFTETDPTVPSHVKSITTGDKTNWNAAYGWGDHSLEGYLTSFTETDPTVPSYVKNIAALDITNWNDAFGWGDHSQEGYLTSFTETDPTVPSHVKAITVGNVSNWNSAYGWGDHSLEGYLKSYTETDPTVPSHVKSITTGNLSNWNSAYGWGNHANAGYFKATGGTISGNVTVTGNITVTGNVDGRDVSADGTTLDGVVADLDTRPFVATDTSTAAGVWSGTVPGITSLYDGLVVMMIPSQNGASGGTTFNLNGLGDVNVYLSSTGRLTTHYGINTFVILAYDSDRNGGCWVVHADYNSTESYTSRWNDSTVIAGTQLHGYQLLLEGVDGKFYPVTEGGVANSTTNTVSTAPFKVGGQVLYYSSTNDIAPGGNIGATYESVQTGDGEYWMNRASGSAWATVRAPFYLVGSIDANGQFFLDNTTTTSFLTQDLPTSEDGKVYLQVGWMIDNDDTWRLSTHHPIFHYENGAVRLFVASHQHSFSEITNKPTTLSGYGITDALPLAGGTVTGVTHFHNTLYANTQVFEYSEGTVGTVTYSPSETALVIGATNVLQLGGNDGIELDSNTYVTASHSLNFRWSSSDVASMIGQSYGVLLTGSLQVNGDITATGNVTGNNLAIGNWNSAYGWGDHSQEGYLKSIDISGKADTSHKYHEFTAGEYYFDSFSQNRNLRLFTENAVYDDFRFCQYTNVERWNGTSWEAWTAGNDMMYLLLDGREDTVYQLDRANREFRFEITRNNGWPLTSLFVFQQDWHGINVGGVGIDITVETWNGTSWDLKETINFGSGGNTDANFGLHTYVSGNLHNGVKQTRVTVRIDDWADTTNSTMKLKRIMLLSNYLGAKMQPWTWNHDKEVIFDAPPKTYVNSSYWDLIHAYGGQTIWGDLDVTGNLSANDVLTATVWAPGSSGLNLQNQDESTLIQLKKDSLGGSWTKFYVDNTVTNKLQMDLNSWGNGINVAQWIGIHGDADFDSENDSPDFYFHNRAPVTSYFDQFLEIGNRSVSGEVRGTFVDLGKTASHTTGSSNFVVGSTDVTQAGFVLHAQVTSNGSANVGKLGFFGADPVAKPTVTDLASLGTALSNLGLITDSSGGLTGGSTIDSGTDLVVNRINVVNTGDVTLTNGASAPIMVGVATSTNVAIDGNEIQARNNGAAATLNLNADGGIVSIGSGGLSTGGNISAADLTATDDIILNTNNTSALYGRHTGGSTYQIARVYSDNTLRLGDQSWANVNIYSASAPIWLGPSGNETLLHTGSAIASSQLGIDVATFGNVDNGNTFGVGAYLGFNAYYDTSWKAKATQDGAFYFRNSGDGVGLQLVVQDGAVTAGAAFGGDSYYFRDGDLYSGTNKFWHAGNDGAGSGLDADKLDGVEASGFLRSNTNDSFSYTLTASSQNNGIAFTYVANASTPAFDTSGSSITGGADFAGLGKRNNVDVQTWYGFSVSSTYGSGTVAQGSPAFSVDARSGNAYVAGDMYVEGSNYLGDGKAVIRFNDNWLRLNPNSEFTSGIYMGTSPVRTDGVFQVGSTSTSSLYVNGGTVNIQGNAVYHAGNLNLANYVATAGGSTASDLTVTNYIKLGPGVPANDDAHIEWLGTSNAGYLRFSTSDDNGAEYMEFGDYDTVNRGGAFTRWLQMWRGEMQFTGNFTATTIYENGTSLVSKYATLASANTFTSANYFKTAAGDITTIGSGATMLEVQASANGNDALMRFHVPSDYAAYFGLSSGLNDFVVGGYSMGANEYRVWHDGNVSTVSPQTSYEMPGSQNLDTYTNAGFYHQGANADATSGTNYPIGHAGSMIVLPSAGMTQLYITYNGSSRAFMRNSYQTWSAWKEFAFNGDNGSFAALSGSSIGTGYVPGTANSVACSNWFRSNGSTGWYNDSYGGGIMMQDTTYVRIHGSKQLYVANQILATSNITAYYSDERLKDIHEELDPEQALSSVRRWRKVRYTANELAAELGNYDTSKQEIGLLAGEIGEEYPELTPLAPFDIEVSEFDGVVTSKSGDEYKTLDYERTVAVEAAAITALADRSDCQAELIAKLMARIEELEAKVNAAN